MEFNAILFLGVYNRLRTNRNQTLFEVVQNVCGKFEILLNLS